jgi:ABC-type xylose transport system permease subunit
MIKEIRNDYKILVVIIIIIIIIMFMKDYVCFLFLDPQNEFGPSISSSVVLCSVVLLVCIVALVLVFYLCPSSVRVVTTFPGTV